MVVDTNILIHHYEALRTFVADVERCGAPVVVVVPGTVIYEMDGLKNRDEVAWPARRASGWLLERVREKKSVKVQATEETCKASRNWRSKDEAKELIIPGGMMNDHLVLDCVQYFQMSTRRRTFLCTEDTNVLIFAQGQGIEVLSPCKSKPWTSRDIAIALYGNIPAVSQHFSGDNAAYRQITVSGAAGAGDGDGMMIDDEIIVEETPLNVLHDDVREYFTRLLIDAALKIGGRALLDPVDPGSLSRYASNWRRKPCTAWSAVDAIEYFWETQPGLQQEIDGLPGPRLTAFLGKRYTGVVGARRGDDWSLGDWIAGFTKLERLGKGMDTESRDMILAASRELREYVKQRVLAGH
ncbi:hypothetical protein CC1G_14645 [Coprinopsis cinerea okayama7|uniref:PIN domain-containing protein n=1 Tax=Coprinopsis cinerea (strain Okayama-7 / 130 / ATCC MYA-4618 / FGSC 9003) TaxID=240176 RepID=D6RMI3_COPC7|nr:hypothetical protein CC1G_14645 [Coprinopsis cinerea okayama7\|eukprot:XP_002911216.1 hypothetical protein CC1G_14645 [Coprinopsis cinerea okayama7\